MRSLFLALAIAGILVHLGPAHRVECGGPFGDCDGGPDGIVLAQAPAPGTYEPPWVIAVHQMRMAVSVQGGAPEFKSRALCDDYLKRALDEKTMVPEGAVACVLKSSIGKVPGARQ